MKQHIPDREELLKQKIVFCTECGEQLENFCFSSGIKDINAVRQNLLQCKKSGKFVGEFCSKLFIADPEMREALWDEITEERLKQQPPQK